jgi:peptidyl-prolyl cis-trans isomerase B (cyclophilin B)
MIASVPVLLLLAMLVPERGWYPADQPVIVRLASSTPARLVLADFAGRVIEPQEERLWPPDSNIDLKALYSTILPGGYVLYEVPADKQFPAFVGNPLVVSVRGDPRPIAPRTPLAWRIEPLRYVVIDTDLGAMTAGLYYDVAPRTVANFLDLAGGRFYDGMPFNRIVPGVLVQTGDPRGDLTGGPGHTIPAEFNERPHVAGALSMARLEDPVESQGVMPRPQFANSAGSQFFICVDEEKTRQLDRRYTVFGCVVDGLDVLRKLAETPVDDPQAGKPLSPVRVRSIRVFEVDPEHNPYERLFSSSPAPTTQDAATLPWRALRQRLASTPQD